MKIHYYSPSGNDTILVEKDGENIQKCDYKSICDGLLKQYPKAEQVGFVSFEENAVLLEMAGGEFCGNASLSSAVCWCEHFQKCKNQGNKTKVTVKICGMELNCDVTKTGEKQYIGSIEMPECIGVEEKAILLDNEIVKAPLILFDGIGHLILEKEYSKNQLEESVRKYCKEWGLPSLGIMTYYGNSLLPLVYVDSVDTLYWENSCASGSTATAVYLSYRQGKEITIDLKQPGGTLNVTANNGSAILRNTIIRQ